MSIRRTATVITATVLAILALLAIKNNAKAKVNAAESVTKGQTVTITGPQIVLTHGIVQVRATIKDGRLTDVVALQLPHDNPDSWNYSQRAAPILRSEAIAMQSANINVVSGATFTSRGYARSLQAALDAAGIKS